MAEPKPEKGVGISPKLVLWGVVILAGFFYLRSINEKGFQDKPDEVTNSAAQTASVESARQGAVETAPAVPTEPVTSSKIGEDSGEWPKPIVSGDEQSISEPPESAVAKPGAPAMSAVGITGSSDAKSPQMAEPTALPAEGTAMAQQPESGSKVVGELSHTGSSFPASVALESDSAARSTPAESSEGSLSAEAVPAAPSLPNEPKTQREGGTAPREQVRMQRVVTKGAGKTSGPVPSQAPKHSDAQKRWTAQEPTVSGSPAPRHQEASLSVSPGAAAGKAAATDLPRESFEEQRARVMAEYQALRRERWELMREYWEYMGAPGRRSMRPHGFYPGYAPEYYRPWQ